MAALGRRLLEAAAEGDDEAARSVAARGANLNVLNDFGETALIIAARGNHEVIAADLARRGAELEAPDALHGWTALLVAAARGSLGIARVLIDCCASVNATGKNGESPLMLAALLGHTVVTEFLLEAGAEVDLCAHDGKCSLTHACYKGYWATALCLVQHQASLDVLDLGGRTPVAWAAFSGHEHILRLLIERRADKETRDHLGWTALMLAAHSGHCEAVLCLLQRQADVEARGDDGETATMLAALNGHTHVVRLLASQGADVDAVAQDGMTPLRLAAEAGHFNTAWTLAEFGAEMPEEGLTVARPELEDSTLFESEERWALESPGGLALTPKLALQLILDFETGDATCDIAAERWGFAATELGYRRLLRVVEEAGEDAERLKSALQDGGVLPKDPCRDGLFDWNDIGGIEDED